MKKELFAGVLLLVLIGLCAWNLRYLSRMCTQLDEAAAQAEASCAAGDPARASETMTQRAEVCGRSAIARARRSTSWRTRAAFAASAVS